MRIVYVTRGWTVHDRRFAFSLVEAGHQVAYRAVESIPPQGEAALARPGIASVASWGASGPSFWPRVPKMVRALRGLGEEWNADIVHAGPIQRGALVAALAGRRPTLSMSWGSDILRDARVGAGRWQASFVLRRSDALACDCETVRARCVELGMDPARIVVFPWGVDLDKFAPGSGDGLRSSLGWEKAMVMVAARAWEPLYGMGLVAEAFVLASKKEPNLRLLMLGDGSERERIRGRLGGLIASSHLPGQVDHSELPRYLSAADVYVSASRSDGSSVTLLESMAAGLPAIVSDIAPNREWVKDGVNGWVFRDGEAQSLAAAILRACASRQELPALGQAARRTVEARADWRANFPRLLEAYELARAAWRMKPHAA
ncbi:MAG TPA: glycosyltransferase family 4 protein [Anaerolineales bacterium]|nr:glycosyltransferase family 4 protein [Anaerolineales bacterium]